MKQLVFALCMLAAAAPIGFAGEWKLVWSDEFDYEGLPDPAKWDYEEGFVRNHEMQYYTRGRKENARVEYGLLVIEGRKEPFANSAHKPGSPDWRAQRGAAEYTAASLVTRGKASWTFGRIEVRARLPHGKGVWPAVWTLGAGITSVGWPRCGEIDVMEFVGKDPSRVHANAHYAADGQHRSTGGKLETERPYADFHLYAVEWCEDRIDFFFDDIKYHTFTVDEAGDGTDNPFRKPHYLLVNLALGGTWGGDIDDAVLPQKYLIDYVRVYEQTNGTEQGARTDGARTAQRLAVVPAESSRPLRAWSAKTESASSSETRAKSASAIDGTASRPRPADEPGYKRNEDRARFR